MEKQVVYEIGVIVKKFATAEWSSNTTRWGDGEELSRLWLPFLSWRLFFLYFLQPLGPKDWISSLTSFVINVLVKEIVIKLLHLLISGSPVEGLLCN